MVTNLYANSPILMKNSVFLGHPQFNKLRSSIIINLNIRKKITAYCLFCVSLQVLS